MEKKLFNDLCKSIKEAGYDIHHPDKYKKELEVAKKLLDYDTKVACKKTYQTHFKIISYLIEAVDNIVSDRDICTRRRVEKFMDKLVLAVDNLYLKIDADETIKGKGRLEKKEAKEKECKQKSVVSAKKKKK